MGLLYLNPILAFTIFLYFNCFRLHPSSNIVSHSTQYALIVHFTYVRFPEDGLKNNHNVLP